MKLLLTCILVTCIQAYGFPTASTSSYNQSIISISSSFLVMPTDGLSVDDEVRAARVAETHTPPLLSPENTKKHEELPKFPEDEYKGEQEEPQEQQQSKNIIAGIVGASGAGLVAIVAVGLFIWHSQRRSSTKESDYNEPISPVLLPPTSKPTITNSSYFDEWDRRQRDICHSVAKFPLSTHSALSQTSTHNSRTNAPSHLREAVWTSDSGSSESLSIRDLSSFAENSTANYELEKPAASFQSATQSNYTRSITSSERLGVVDKVERHGLSLVNRKLLHYPAVSRVNTASSSKKMSDDSVSEYSLQRLFRLPGMDFEEHQPAQMSPTRHNFTTPFDLPASKFIPLTNCPFTLVTRQSILNDPHKRQGLHEIPK